MSDWGAVIAGALGFSGVILTIVLSHLWTDAKLVDLHLTMNSRLDELITLTRKAAFAEGVASMSLQQKVPPQEKKA